MRTDDADSRPRSLIAPWLFVHAPGTVCALKGHSGALRGSALRAHAGGGLSASDDEARVIIVNGSVDNTRGRRYR